MSLQVIELGEVEPVTIYVVNVKGEPLAGLTDLYIKVRRGSDGWYLDWNDLTFKASLWTDLVLNLSEVDATNAQGVYDITGGFDSSTVTNLATTEDLLFIVTQTPGTDATLPPPTELQVRPGAGSLSPASIANAVWESLRSAHLTPDTMGAAMSTILESHVLADLEVVAGATSSVVNTNATQPNGFYTDVTLLVVNAAGSAVRRTVSYSQTNGAFTLEQPLPFTPSVGDTVYPLTRSDSLAQIQAQVDKIDLVPTLGVAAVTTGSLMDRLMNKNASKTYNQATDSMEALRDREG